MAADTAVRGGGGRAPTDADSGGSGAGGAAYLAGPLRSFTSEGDDDAAVTIR